MWKNLDWSAQNPDLGPIQPLWDEPGPRLGAGPDTISAGPQGQLDIRWKGLLYVHILLVAVLIRFSRAQFSTAPEIEPSQCRLEPHEKECVKRYVRIQILIFF